MAVCLSPLMVTHLRAQPDVMVTCSDACESGAGVAASAGLSAYGVRSVLALPAELPQDVSSGLALVSLFGGIEAGRRALDILGITPVRHVAVEIDNGARRAAHEVWPDIHYFRDIVEFSRQVIHDALSGVGTRRVLVEGGSPCQGLSADNATKNGFEDPRSKLFFEMIRVIKDLSAEKLQVYYMGENVASMDAKDQDIFSKYMGTEPYVADAADIAQVRRKRFYWINWQVAPAAGVAVESARASTKLRFQATLPSPKAWTDPGWVWEGDSATHFPTFMRAIAKKKETFKPAGIALTPADARRRWRADLWRYPPYQYKRNFCFRNVKRPRILRVASSRERELLMFLGEDMTKFAMNTAKIKEAAQEYEDVRCSLIGNSFHAGVVALLFAPLMVKLGLLERRPGPQDIVDRMGLRPGEVYYPGLACGLNRPKDFHRLDGARRGYVHPTAEAARNACSPSTSTALELKAVNSLIRASDYRGSDVRLDSGELLRPAVWPRRSIDPARWEWFPLVAHRFKDPEHISILEVRAAHTALKWRARSTRRIFSRFFHLMDSQVALSVLIKGRSSSYRLNTALRRTNALTVAAWFFPSYGFFMSEWNPSDKPSRRWEKGGRRKSAQPRRRRVKKIRVVDGFVRRNVKFNKEFDSTLGYPGEGPARRKMKARSTIRTRMIKTPGPARRVRRQSRERIPTRRTQAERIFERRDIRLRDVMYAPVTRSLYRLAFVELWKWVGRPPPLDVSSPRLYDSLLAEFIEHAWSSGMTRGDAGNALSASVFAYPNLRGRGRLSESWLLLNTWAKLEAPFRAPPLPGLVVLALIWYLVRRRRYDAAFLVAAGFDGFLRTGEMLNLMNKDVQIGADNLGAIRFAFTKSGQRHAAFESSTVQDPLVGRLFRLHVAHSPQGQDPEAYIFSGSKCSFYELFEDGLSWLGVSHLRFKPYSLRRGGATAFFRKWKSMELTLERGRWASARIGRIYIYIYIYIYIVFTCRHFSIFPVVHL